MSAFFFAINRDGHLFSSTLAEQMMRPLDQFGTDGRRLLVRQNFALGYQTRWTVPEELSEFQPLTANSNTVFAFVGRIDNRAHLITALKKSSSPVAHAVSTKSSDAVLLQAFITAFGQVRLTEVVGPFVFLLYDLEQRELMIARDAMGGRHLVYAVRENVILVATYEMALVAHPDVDYRFCQRKLGYALAMQQESKTLPLIKGVLPLEPGFVLTIKARSNTKRQLTRFYTAPTNTFSTDTLLDDQAYARQFRYLHEQAVARRLRGIGPVATSLSGGLDSVPIAIAASQTSSVDAPHQAFSWVFNQVPQADERRYSQAVCRDFGIQQYFIVCDEIWPQFDENTHVNPVYPFSTPYSEYQQQTFAQARSHGIKHLLTGIHGDMLFGHGENAIFQLLMAGEWSAASRLFLAYWRRTSSRKALVKNTLIKPIPWLQRYLYRRQKRRFQAPSWMMPSVAEQLALDAHPLLDESWSKPRPRQWQNLFGGFAGSDMALGRTMEAKYQIDRRYPLRDRDLVEFMASVPSTQLLDGFVHRPIVLRAYENELPNSIKVRNDKTSFDAAIFKGIAADRKALSWLNKDTHWQNYVKRAEFSTMIESLVDERLAMSTSLLAWRCAYYNFWHSVCYPDANISGGKQKQ